MGVKVTMLVLLMGAVVVSAQMLEIQIQDQIPKMMGMFGAPECPADNMYPVVIASQMTEMNLWSNQYVICIRGVPLIFNCSEGLFFNPDTLSCDFPYERRKTVVSTEQEIPDSPQYPIPINPDMKMKMPAMMEKPITRPYPVPMPMIPMRPVPYMRYKPWEIIPHQ